MMPVNKISILILVCGLKSPVHRSSSRWLSGLGLPSRLKKNMGFLAEKLVTIMLNP